VGVRGVDLSSHTDANLRGVPDWNIPDAFAELGAFNPVITHTTYSGFAVADREFKGFGPTVTREAAYPFASLGDGRFDIDWSLTGGVLFGRQQMSFMDQGTSYYIAASPFQFLFPGQVVPPTPTIAPLAPHAFKRSSDATVPNFEASLGVGYSIGGFTAQAGYRWERYQNAIDGGLAEHKSEDRTMDGPYFKLGLGFGG
jgi:hypothetical protein